ncbi:hypothetical protein N7457_004177 [Penicillium paradoxum]|uniref:uncharacterized protein n=1 Tax=Penicillium paradoxum TaxID=176176 RepID=UPI0025476D3B|nr:uncharacterized protein N7457_004177 [Penicillium paradoxum]KAJ5782403.1 hypothetical protein N7457_004177 [Penicillium paradoxum]
MLSRRNDLPSPPPLVSLSASKPINDATFNRFATLLAIKILGRFRLRHGNVVMLTNRICVKYGSRIDLSEASAMLFISENTSIPVPKVLCAFVHSGCTYIVMERIEGDIIGNGWVRRSADSQTRLLSQLKEMIMEMRELQPPANTVASVDGRSLFDCRIGGPFMRFGPFATIQDFHRHLRGGMEFDSRLDPDVQDLIKRQNNSWPMKFTHGDLSSLNILARGDTIVGIIDWETAGWYPSYWEYTTACQVNPQNSFWINEIDRFLQPMPEELAMEKIRQRRF